MEGGHVTGLRGVVAARRPSPDQPVRCGGELGARHDLPELQILTNLVEAEVALDVACPGVAIESVRHGSRLPSSLGDAAVEVRHELAHGLATNPSVLPEQGGLPIPNDRERGCLEQGSFRGRELKV